MKKFLKQFLAKFHSASPIHKCDFKCVGWASHFNQVGEIQKGIDNPSWYHYPNSDVMKHWIKMGWDYARVMQSMWECSCGKHYTFFFLAKPSKGCGNKIPQPDTIPQWVYDEMITHNPLMLGSSRGSSLSEVVNELTEKLC